MEAETLSFGNWQTSRDPFSGRDHLMLGWRRKSIRKALWWVLLPLLVAFAVSTGAFGSQWVFMRSSYSHSADGSRRVVQYAPEPTVVLQHDPTFLRSGFRHSEMHLRSGRSADRFHLVETWGQGAYVRPYGEWEYPFRAGATPFGPWGNPQGPWTTPFGAWVNPYGLGQLPSPPWYLYWPGGGPYLMPGPVLVLPGGTPPGGGSP